MTELDKVCEILGELWLDYRNDEGIREFATFNDIGLPAAYLVSHGIVLINEMSAEYIGQTWQMFLDLLELEDTGFDSLDEILNLVKE